MSEKRTSATQGSVRCCESPELRQVGSDIWPGGGEAQYICDSCGRLVCDVHFYSEEIPELSEYECPCYADNYHSYHFWEWSEQPIEEAGECYEQN